MYANPREMWVKFFLGNVSYIEFFRITHLISSRFCIYHFGSQILSNFSICHHTSITFPFATSHENDEQIQLIRMTMNNFSSQLKNLQLVVEEFRSRENFANSSTHEELPMMKWELTNDELFMRAQPIRRYQKCAICECSPLLTASKSLTCSDMWRWAHMDQFSYNNHKCSSAPSTVAKVSKERLQNKATRIRPHSGIGSAEKKGPWSYVVLNQNYLKTQ